CRDMNSGCLRASKPGSAITRRLRSGTRSRTSGGGTSTGSYHAAYEVRPGYSAGVRLRHSAAPLPTRGRAPAKGAGGHPTLWRHHAEARAARGGGATPREGPMWGRVSPDMLLGLLIWLGLAATIILIDQKLVEQRVDAATDLTDRSAGQ